MLSLNKGYQSTIIGSKENSIAGHKRLNTLMRYYEYLSWKSVDLPSAKSLNSFIM
jgi:hypothetical protein